MNLNRNVYIDIKFESKNITSLDIQTDKYNFAFGIIIFILRVNK